MSKPGPTNYNITVTKSHQNSVFGKEKRASLASDNQVPGPGSYKQTLQGNMPIFSMPKGAASTFKISNNPGPGSYDPLHTQDKASSSKMVMGKDAKKPFYD